MKYHLQIFLALLVSFNASCPAEDEINDVICSPRSCFDMESRTGFISEGRLTIYFDVYGGAFEPGAIICGHLDQIDGDTDMDSIMEYEYSISFHGENWLALLTLGSKDPIMIEKYDGESNTICYTDDYSGAGYQGGTVDLRRFWIQEQTGRTLLWGDVASIYRMDQPESIIYPPVTDLDSVRADSVVGEYQSCNDITQYFSIRFGDTIINPHTSEATVFDGDSLLVTNVSVAYYPQILDCWMTASPPSQDIQFLIGR